MRKLICGLAVALLAVLASQSALACVFLPITVVPEPTLPGESPEAYAARVKELMAQREAQWDLEQQAYDLERADLIFIARKTQLPPSVQPVSGQSEIIVQGLRNSNLQRVHFTPIDWFKGPVSRQTFLNRLWENDCGWTRFGDVTADDAIGQRYVFFARSGRISQDTLIDAIAVDRITDPALLDFVARHRTVRVAIQPGTTAPQR